MRRALLFGPAVILLGAGLVGDAIWPTLVAHHPLLLAALTTRLTHLLLVAPKLSAVAFVTVVGARNLVAAALGYVIGRRYSSWVMVRLGNRVGAQRAARAGEVAKAAGPWAAFIAPLLTVSAVVGAAGTAPAPFALAAVGGVALRVVALHFIGHAFAHELARVVDWVDGSRWILVAASAGLIVLVEVGRRASRGRGPVAATAGAGAGASTGAPDGSGDGLGAGGGGATAAAAPAAVVAGHPEGTQAGG